MMLDNVIPKGNSTRFVIRNLTEITGIEKNGDIITNLIDNAHRLIALEIVAFVFRNRNLRVNVRKNANVFPNLVENELPLIDTFF